MYVDNITTIRAAVYEYVKFLSREWLKGLDLKEGSCQGMYLRWSSAKHMQRAFHYLQTLACNPVNFKGATNNNTFIFRNPFQSILTDSLLP